MNRAWRPLSREEFEELTFDELEVAIGAAQLTKHDTEWIWERERVPFEVW